MEFTRRGPAAAAAEDDGRRFPEPPPHGDSLLVTRDALLSQLQEIIEAELTKFECAMALRAASTRHGISTPADADRASYYSREDDSTPHQAKDMKPTTKASPSVKWSCAICQVEATSAGNLLQHFAGQKHQSNAIALLPKAKAEKSRKARQFAEKPRPVWVCRFCRANCTCRSLLENHLNGKRHRAEIRALMEQSRSMETSYTSLEVEKQDEKQASVWFCGICQVKCPCQAAMDSHFRGKKHRTHVQALQREAKRVESIAPKVAESQQSRSDWGCSICQAKCNSQSQFQDHCKSRGHQQRTEALQREGKNAKLSGFETAKKLPSDCSSSKGASSEGMEMQRTLYFCKLCNLQCNSKNMLAEHRQGKRHLERAEIQKLSSFCKVCNLQCNSEKMLVHHCTGKNHRAKVNGY